MNHLVISPFWMTRVLEADKGKRTAPSPLDMVESLTEQRNFAGFGASLSVKAELRNLDVLLRWLGMAHLVQPERERESKWAQSNLLVFLCI